MYTTEVISDEVHCREVMFAMEEGFGEKDEGLFINVIERQSSLVIRVHAVCILATLGTSRSVPILSDVVLNDPDPLVRHEAAFSLGQIGENESEPSLVEALRTDAEAIVRHESAAALGSIGLPSSRPALEEALKDKDVLVVSSARTSLFNIAFLQKLGRAESARDHAPRP